MNDNWWALASLVLSLAFTGLGWRLLASGRRFMYAHLWMACLLALQTGALCVKAYQTGMCPIRGASEVIFFLSWTINLFYLLLGRAYRMSVLGIFTAPAIAVLTALSLLIGLFGPDVQGAHDFWVTAHVGVVMMSYGAGGLAAAAGKPVSISSMCAVFAETEIIGLLAQGTAPADIAAGVFLSIARRMRGLAARVPLRRECTFTGGLATSPAFSRLLAAELGVPVNVPDDPQTVGALGAALVAAR